MHHKHMLTHCVYGSDETSESVGQSGPTVPIPNKIWSNVCVCVMQVPNSAGKHSGITNQLDFVALQLSDLQAQHFKICLPYHPHLSFAADEASATARTISTPEHKS